MATDWSQFTPVGASQGQRFEPIGTDWSQFDPIEFPESEDGPSPALIRRQQRMGGEMPNLRPDRESEAQRRQEEYERELVAKRGPFPGPDEGYGQPTLGDVVAPDDVEAADYGRSAMAGAAGIGTGAGWLLEQLGEERIGQGLQDLGRRGSEYWMEGMSPGAQRALQRQFVEDDGSLGDFSAQTVGLMGAQSAVPTMLGMGGGGLLARGLAAQGAGSAAAGAIGYGLGEAGVSAPMTAADVEREVLEVPIEELSERPAYQEIRGQFPEGPEGDEAARAAMADAAAKRAFALTGATTFGMSAPAGAAFSRMFRGVPQSGSRLENAGRGALTEFAQEFGQSGAEEIGSNIAMSPAIERNPFAGSLNAALGGGLAGAGIGGAFGLASPVAPEQTRPPTPAEVDAANAGIDPGILENAPPEFREGMEDASAVLDDAVQSRADEVLREPQPEPQPQSQPDTGLMGATVRPREGAQPVAQTGDPMMDYRPEDLVTQIPEQQFEQDPQTAAQTEADALEQAIDREEDITSPVPAERLPKVRRREGGSRKWDDARLKRKSFREGLQAMSSSLRRGGGAMGRYDTYEGDRPREGNEFIGVPSENPRWFQGIAANEGISVEGAQKAVDKALKGRPLGEREARVVETMLDIQSFERMGGNTETGEGPDTAESLLAQYREQRRADRGLLTEAEIDARAEELAERDQDMIGQFYTDQAYEADMARADRALYDLAQDAAAVDEVAVNRILESNRDETESIRELWEITQRGRDGQGNEGVPGEQGQGAQEPAAQQGQEARATPPTDQGFRLQGQVTPEQRVGRQEQQADAFNAPTESQQGAERRRREVQGRLQGQGSPDMMQGEGELFAGPRPEQVDLVDDTDLTERTRADVAGETPERATLTVLRNMLDAATDSMNDTGGAIPHEVTEQAIDLRRRIDRALAGEENLADVQRDAANVLDDWSGRSGMDNDVAEEFGALQRQIEQQVQVEGPGQQALDRPAVDRRQDTERRRRVDEMSPEEMRRELMVDDLTGLGTRRAFNEALEDHDGPVVSIDADSLKWINDNMSPDAGDELLRAVGRAIGQHTEDGFHTSGDEFYLLPEAGADVDSVLEAIDSELAGAVLRVDKADGRVITKTGVEITHGQGKTKDEADDALKQEKQSREERGERAARGEEPPGISREPARVSGEPGAGRQADRDAAERPPVAEVPEAVEINPRTLRTVSPGDRVDGRLVREEVPNQSSISASLDDYLILDGIREIPINAFDPEYVNSVRSGRLDRRTQRLADEIERSGEINPLIVAFDAEGPYILEGGHRFDALIKSGARSVPAMVVIEDAQAPPDSGRRPELPTDQPAQESPETPPDGGVSRSGPRMVESGDFRTGQPVTFEYLHNTESATDQFGVPDRDAPYGRGFEPSGRYVTEAPETNVEATNPSLERGTLTFTNPLVIDNSDLGWKRQLSEQYDGKTGKELSQALIDAGYDGVVTVNSPGTRREYVSEILDLTTFDPSAARYSRSQPGSAREISDQWRERGVTSSVSEQRGIITLNDVVVPEGQRGQGIGSEFMRELTDYADRTGQRIGLTPSADRGASSVARLRRFYRQFGFVPNRGRNQDFEISESMVREPQGEARYARGEGPAGTTPETFRESFTPRAQRALFDSGLVTVTQSPTEWPGSHPADAAGAWINGKVYIATDNVRPGAERGLMLHEVGVHHGLKDMLGDDYGRLVGRLKRQVRLGQRENATRAQREAYQAHQRALADETIAGDDTALWEETIAYMAESGADTPLLKRIGVAVRRFLRRLWLVRDFTNADIADLARGSVERVMAGDSAREPVYAQPRYQRAEQPDAPTTDQTQTPEFRRWFGDSKVVDESGDPLVVYHGTSRSFDQFSDDRLGSSTGARSAGQGHFFVSNPEVAGAYADYASSEDIRAIMDRADRAERRRDWDEHQALIEEAERLEGNRERGQAIVPAYLSIQNPAIHDAGGADYVSAEGGISDFIEAAKADGHDGVIIRNLQDDPRGNVSRPQDHFIAFRPEQIKSATGNTGAFDPANPDIRYSRSDSGFVADPANPNQPARPGKEIFSTTVYLGRDSNGKAVTAQTSDPSLKEQKALKKHARRLFTKEGLLTPQAFARHIETHGLKNADEVDVQFFTHDVTKRIKRVYGKRMWGSVPQAEMEKMNEYLAGQEVEGLDERVTDALDVLRGSLDRMSGRLQTMIADEIRFLSGDMNQDQRVAFLDNYQDAKNGDEAALEAIEGLPHGDQIARRIHLMSTIEENKGSYLNRSYRVFDDPSWRPDAEVMGRARTFLREQVDRNPEFSDLSGKAKDDHVEGIINSILNNNSGGLVEFLSSDMLGRKDLSVLKRRKQIAPEIRDLMGEHKDPRLNFARSMTKMSGLVANHHFLSKVREDGLGAFMSTRQSGLMSVQIAQPGDPTMLPMGGLWSTPDFAQAMRDYVKSGETEAWLRAAYGANAAIKYGKTVLSPTTSFRNFWSASMFTVMNGHFSYRHSLKAAQHTWADLSSRNMSRHDYIRKLAELGVLHDNPHAAELEAAMDDAMDMDPYAGGMIKRAAKVPLNIATRIYRAGDDFWKIIGFENEKASLIKNGVRESEAEALAADRIRNGYPTYSMVPAGIRWVRRFPLAGTFVSFPWEVMRTTGHQFRIVGEDLKAGRNSMAAKRMVGMSVAGAGTYAISSVLMSMFGIDDEDDEAIRELAAPWQRNSQFAYLPPDEEGNVRYLDLTHLDPYAYLKLPLRAIMNGNNETIAEKAGQALKEMLEPFIGSDIGATALVDIWKNKKAGTGAPVYDESATPAEKGWRVFNYLRETLQPGAFANMERTLKAVRGEVTSYSKKYKVRDEILGWVGFRLTTSEPDVSLKFRSLDFRDAYREALSPIYRTLRDPNPIDESDVRSAVRTADERWSRAFRELHSAIRAAKVSGMTDREIARVLADARVAKKHIRPLVNLEVPPWEPSTQSINSAASAATTGRNTRISREDFRERLDALREAYREIRDRQDRS